MEIKNPSAEDDFMAGLDVQQDDPLANDAGEDLFAPAEGATVEAGTEPIVLKKKVPFYKDEKSPKVH